MIIWKRKNLILDYNYSDSKIFVKCKFKKILESFFIQNLELFINFWYNIELTSINNKER